MMCFYCHVCFQATQLQLNSVNFLDEMQKIKQLLPNVILPVKNSRARLLEAIYLCI